MSQRSISHSFIRVRVSELFVTYCHLLVVHLELKQRNILVIPAVLWSEARMEAMELVCVCEPRRKITFLTCVSLLSPGHLAHI